MEALDLGPDKVDQAPGPSTLQVLKSNIICRQIHYCRRDAVSIRHLCTSAQDNVNSRKHVK